MSPSIRRRGHSDFSPSAEEALVFFYQSLGTDSLAYLANLTAGCVREPLLHRDTYRQMGGQLSYSSFRQSIMFLLVADENARKVQRSDAATVQLRAKRRGLPVCRIPFFTQRILQP